jgi:hypothetical protein
MAICRSQNPIVQTLPGKSKVAVLCQRPEGHGGFGDYPTVHKGKGYIWVDKVWSRWTLKHKKDVWGRDAR